MKQILEILKILPYPFFAAIFLYVGWQAKEFTDKKEAIQKHNNSTLSKIRKRGFLNVAILNSANTFYLSNDGKEGFEYDLIKDFAKNLNVELNLTVVHSIDEALEMADTKKFDIVSSMITKTPKRELKYEFGPTYFRVQQQLICNKNVKKRHGYPRSEDDLSHLDIFVLKNSSYEENMISLQEEIPDINFTVIDDISSEHILDMISKEKFECSIMDSNIYQLNQRYYPKTFSAFALSDKESLAWIIPDNSDELKERMFVWINNFEHSGRMASLKDHYYDYTNYFNYYNLKVFKKRIITRLPKYEKYFKNASNKFGIDWKILAATSYQESHWSRYAKSHTGVRGIMMLTLKTAKQMGVENRLDPKESIYGGAKYMRRMIDRVPEDVIPEDKMKFALAAYNVGMGHIHDARTLARKLNKDRSSWKDVRQVLPFLTQKKYYRYLKYGYARGNEPVGYVSSIYNYRDVLIRDLNITSMYEKNTFEAK